MAPPLDPPEAEENATADLTGVIRARKQRVWLRRLLALASVLAVLALLAVAWFSPVLALSTVDVTGSRLVDETEVAEFVTAEHAGTPLPQLRLGTVEDEVLSEFPRLGGASLHYSGPRGISIELTDRRPVLAVASGEGFRLFDAEAVDLGTVSKAPEDLTVLEDSGAAPDEETVDEVIAFMADLRPDLRENLQTITAADERSIAGTITTGEDEAEVVFGDSERASQKLRIALQLAADGRTEIDVSVPSVPVTN